MAEDAAERERKLTQTKPAGNETWPALLFIDNPAYPAGSRSRGGADRVLLLPVDSGSRFLRSRG